MFMNKKILALVPARGGSKGIKLKNIRRINKLSLIGYTSKFIDKCNFFDEKLLSTDSNKIVNEANRFKFKIFKRSTNTSKDYTSDFEVISEVLNHSEIYKKKYDYIIYLQPTSPIRKILQLKDALKTVIKKNYDSSWSVSEIDKKFHPYKILEIKKKNLKLFSAKGQNIFARQMLGNVFIRNGIFYIFKVSSILNKKNIYLKKNFPSITNYKFVNIDNFADLKDFRNIIKSTKDVLNFN